MKSFFMQAEYTQDFGKNNVDGQLSFSGELSVFTFCERGVIIITENCREVIMCELVMLDLI